MTDSVPTCPATTTGWPGCAGRARTTPTCSWSGWAGRPRPAARTSGPTSTSTCCARPAPTTRRTNGCWRASMRTSTSTTCGSCRREVWPDGRQCFVNLQHRPGRSRSRPGSSTCTCRPCPTEHTRIDVRRHGTPIVVHDPDGLIELRHDDEAQTQQAIDAAVEQVRQRGAPASGWSTGRWRAGTTPRRSTSTCASRSVRWCGCCGSSTARGGTTTACATSARTCRPTSAARVAALVPGAESGGGLRAQSAACFAWLDELL